MQAQLCGVALENSILRQPQGGCAPITGHSEPVTEVTDVRIPRMRGHGTTPAFSARSGYFLWGTPVMCCFLGGSMVK
mgnify:CR=1 FL=1